MTEQFRPHPDNPKQLDPIGGVAGPLGKAPPGPEQAAPQGGGGKSPELHPPEEEVSELARENKEFFKKLAGLIDPPPLDEDFHKRLSKRLRQ